MRDDARCVGEESSAAIAATGAGSLAGTGSISIATIGEGAVSMLLSETSAAGTSLSRKRDTRILHDSRLNISDVKRVYRR